MFSYLWSWKYWWYLPSRIQRLRLAFKTRNESSVSTVNYFSLLKEGIQTASQGSKDNLLYLMKGLEEDFVSEPEFERDFLLHLEPEFFQMIPKGYLADEEFLLSYFQKHRKIKSQELTCDLYRLTPFVSDMVNITLIPPEEAKDKKSFLNMFDCWLKEIDLDHFLPPTHLQGKKEYLYLPSSREVIGLITEIPTERSYIYYDFLTRPYELVLKCTWKRNIETTIFFWKFNNGNRKIEVFEKGKKVAQITSFLSKDEGEETSDPWSHTIWFPDRFRKKIDNRIKMLILGGKDVRAKLLLTPEDYLFTLFNNKETGIKTYYLLISYLPDLEFQVGEKGIIEIRHNHQWIPIESEEDVSSSIQMWKSKEFNITIQLSAHNQLRKLIFYENEFIFNDDERNYISFLGNETETRKLLGQDKHPFLFNNNVSLEIKSNQMIVKNKKLIHHLKFDNKGYLTEDYYLDENGLTIWFNPLIKELII